MPEDYDAFADIYEKWVETAPVTERNRPYYVEAYVQTAGLVVELGIGSGRIAIEAAKQGKPIIGVDSSVEMLSLCWQRAEEAGIAELLTLLQADFRDFVLPEPAALIAIPFHTIGHLVRLEDKQAALRHIYTQLAPGGQLLFDHFVFSADLARRYELTPHLRAEYTDPRTGLDVLLWECVTYDYAAQAIRLIAWTEEIDAEGVASQRKYRRIDFSWIDPDQMLALLREAEFQIEALYGDFDRRDFAPDSPEQVWVARRPE